jgi:hypothetical protein
VTVWLTQWLCERRHCALAAAWEPTETTATEVEGRPWPPELNPWCGICGGTLRPESAATVFATMTDARRAFDQVEAAQLASRREMDRLGLTHDVQHTQGALPE